MALIKLSKRVDSFELVEDARSAKITKQDFARVTNQELFRAVLNKVMKRNPQKPIWYHKDMNGKEYVAYGEKPMWPDEMPISKYERGQTP